MFEGLKQWLAGFFALLGMAAGVQAPLNTFSTAAAPSNAPTAAHWPVGSVQPKTKTVASVPVEPVQPIQPIVMPEPKPDPLPRPLPKPPYDKCLYLHASETPDRQFVCPCKYYVMAEDTNIRACRPPVEY
jgi:hypothetical protein